MTTDNEAGGAAKQPAAQKVELQKIYLKDVSLETPSSPAVFKEKWQPSYELELNTQTHALGEDVYDIVLTITITAKNADKTAYLIELQQAGVFTVSGFSPQQLLALKGGFTPVQLRPINFDALYRQHRQERRSGVVH